EKQGPRHCLEVWSCLSLWRMAESSTGHFTVGKIQKTRRQRVEKMYGQQKGISFTCHQQPMKRITLPPHRRERDELAPLQLIGLHFHPASQGRIAGYRIGEDQSAGIQAVDGCLQLTCACSRLPTAVDIIARLARMSAVPMS